MVNAILWSAKIDVPAEGAKVDMDASDIKRNLDWKGKGPKPEPKKAEAK